MKLGLRIFKWQCVPLSVLWFPFSLRLNFVYEKAEGDLDNLVPREHGHGPFARIMPKVENPLQGCQSPAEPCWLAEAPRLCGGSTAVEMSFARIRDQILWGWQHLEPLDLPTFDTCLKQHDVWKAKEAALSRTSRLVKALPEAVDASLR